jgi:hypothetical protein
VGNLKNLLANKISSRKSKFPAECENIPPEISKFSRKIKKSPGK